MVVTSVGKGSSSAKNVRTTSIPPRFTVPTGDWLRGSYHASAPGLDGVHPGGGLFEVSSLSFIFYSKLANQQLSILYSFTPTSRRKSAHKKQQ